MRRLLAVLLFLLLVFAPLLIPATPAVPPPPGDPCELRGYVTGVGKLHER